MAERMTLGALAKDLAEGRTSARKLVRECLDRIADPAGEGVLAFLKVHSEQALAAASAYDQLREAGLAPSPYAGIPISVKDLFDLAGDVTTAGSVALKDAAPALADAPAIARLKAAGFIVIGRTNMTEFAYSGLGLNPHYGTPASPYDRATRRIPGGSSSGAAVSVADGMAAAAIGSDTGGSCRIPAALCGVVGYKPTASVIPRDGAVPLSTTLDSFGPLANSVDCCRVLHQVMSATPLEAPRAATLRGLRIVVPENVMLDNMDRDVADAFDRALRTLALAGATIERRVFPAFDLVAAMNAKIGFSAPEAYAWHRDLIEKRGDQYDPRVLVRMVKAREQTGADYVDILSLRRQLVTTMDEALASFNIMVAPTVPQIAPSIATLEADDALYASTNGLMLRNPSIVNMFDGCAISLPMHRAGEAPTGLMLAASGGRDAALFAYAAAIEQALAV